MYFISTISSHNSVSGAEHVTLVDPATKVDIGKELVSDGFLIAEKNKKDRRLQKLVSLDQRKNIPPNPISPSYIGYTVSRNSSMKPCD